MNIAFALLTFCLMMMLAYCVDRARYYSTRVKINSLIQEIKQEPVSVNQSTYAIKILERLKERL